MKHCPFCGEAVRAMAYHSCKAIAGTVTIRPVRDELTPEVRERLYQQSMQACLEHLKTCTSCKFLAQHDEVCPAMRELRKVRDRHLVEKVTQ